MNRSVIRNMYWLLLASIVLFVPCLGYAQDTAFEDGFEGLFLCGKIVAESIDAPAETDVIPFDANSQDKIALTIANTGGFVVGASAARATLFDPEDKVIDAFNANNQREYVLQTEGTYTVRVNSSDLTSSGTYSLGLACITPPRPTINLTCGEPPISGSIDAPAETDLFTFNGMAGQTISLIVANTGGFVIGISAARATLFAPDGTIMDSFNANNQLDYKLSAEGTYVVRINASTFVNVGTYNLSCTVIGE